MLRGAFAAVAVIALFAIHPAGTQPLPASYPLQSIPTVPAAFATELARMGGPIVQLPVFRKGLHSWPSSGWHARAMYRSTFHWRPLLNGYSSYWPAGFIERLELADQLPARSALARLTRQTGLRAIWVDLQGYSLEDRERWRQAELGFVRGLELRARADGNLLFAVNPVLLGGARVDTPK